MADVYTPNADRIKRLQALYGNGGASQPAMGSTPDLVNQAPTQSGRAGILGGGVNQAPTQPGQAGILGGGGGGGTLDMSPSGLQQALQTLRGLKGQLTAGQITSADFLQQSTPLIQQAANITGTIAGQGSNAANSVNPIWSQFQNENFVKSDQGKWQASLPLSEQEFAMLPDSAKPTADQITKGLVPSAALPGNVALNTQISQQQQQQQGLQQQAQQQSQQTQQNTMGQLQNLFQNFMGQTKQNYDQGYQDIEKSLGNQQQQAMQNLTTGSQGEGFRDYYNNLGLLNSGAFNQGLANQFGNIQQNTQNELLQAKLDEQNALQNAGQQGINTLAAFGTGAQQQLQDITSQGYQTQSGLGVGGLQRQFSLQDFYNQADLQRQLAELNQNTYMSALNQSQQNPWTQLGLGAAGGLFQGAGQGLGTAIGKKF